MNRKLSKTVRNSKVDKIVKSTIKGGKQLYESYERGYFLLKDGKVWKNIVNHGTDTIIMTAEDRNAPLPKSNRKGEG